MRGPSLKQVLAIMVRDGCRVERPPQGEDDFFELTVEGPDPRLSQSFLASYVEKGHGLRFWTRLAQACPTNRLSPRFYLALLCFNRKLFGAILALGDGELYYKSPSHILALPKDYRPLVALALTEASLIEHTLQQLAETRDDPLNIIDRMPGQAEYMDFLRNDGSVS